MQKWDYKKIDIIHTKLEEALESAGNDGWELCASTFLNKTWCLLFKRPQPSGLGRGGQD